MEDDEIEERLRKMGPERARQVLASESSISDRDAGVVACRVCLGMTYKQAGDTIDRSPERVRQIVTKVFRKMRHPSRAHLLEVGSDAG